MGKTVLPLQGIWVQSLVRELGSCMPCSQKKKKKSHSEMIPCLLSTQTRGVRGPQPTSQSEVGAERRAVASARLVLPLRAHS